jgi:hypothetical protein
LQGLQKEMHTLSSQSGQVVAKRGAGGAGAGGEAGEERGVGGARGRRLRPEVGRHGEERGGGEQRRQAKAAHLSLLSSGRP